MIPKIIHYCWFGFNPIPEKYQMCLKSWKKYCKDYKIIAWNEHNYDISSAPLYVRQAYEAKKWAFVSDFVRLDVIYRYGGVYMDTDVELIKKITPLTKNKCYFGYEGCGGINTGLGFGAEKGTPILLELMEYYHNHSFLKDDGSYDETPCPSINWTVFEKYGAKKDNTRRLISGDITLLPKEFFDPAANGRITKNTFSIHHYEGSWKSPENQIRDRINAQKLYPTYQFRKKLCSVIRKMVRTALGERLSKKIKSLMR